MHFVEVLRGRGDCTADGVTAEGKSDHVFILDPDDPLPAKPLSLPVLRAVPWYGYYKAVPVEQPTGMCGPMFGGNYVVTSDSRFSRKYPHPIPVHDRFERP